MITYEDIFNALRKEKYSEDLQELPKSFVSEIASYILEKKEIVSRESDLFAETTAKTKKQLENAVSIIKELFLRRKKKILTLAFFAAETGISKRDFFNMLQHEKELFDVVVKKLEESEKNLSSMLNNIKETKELENQLIRLKQEIPEFIDASSNTIGPFQKGDIANLPREIAKILVDDDRAAYIEGS